MEQSSTCYPAAHVSQLYPLSAWYAEPSNRFCGAQCKIKMGPLLKKNPEFQDGNRQTLSRVWLPVRRCARSRLPNTSGMCLRPAPQGLFGESCLGSSHCNPYAISDVPGSTESPHCREHTPNSPAIPWKPTAAHGMNWRNIPDPPPGVDGDLDFP